MLKKVPVKVESEVCYSPKIVIILSEFWVLWILSVGYRGNCGKFSNLYHFNLHCLIKERNFLFDVLPEQSKTLFIWRFPCVSALYPLIEAKQKSLRKSAYFLLCMFICLWSSVHIHSLFPLSIFVNILILLSNYTLVW